MKESKNIVYLTNFMTESVMKKRNNKNVFSQAANNKVAGIYQALVSVGNKVTILSSGLVNQKSGRFYVREEETAGQMKIVCCAIWDLPILNTVSAIISCYREIKRQNHENEIDNIIFYNYKPEVAWAAWLAKKRLGIPITVEFEDGYSEVKEIAGFKRWIFSVTEKQVGKNIDSAILVNSSMCEACRVPCTVVRGVVNEALYMKSKGYVKSRRKEPKILFSGTLDQIRGIFVLLEALKFTNSQFILEISGRDDSGICERYTDSRVRYLGFLPYQELQEKMLDADIMLQCQLTSAAFSGQSFPSKLFEYISCGNLIISSAIPDVLNFARNQFLIYEHDSPQELARAIDRAIGIWKQQKRVSGPEDLAEENRPIQVGRRIAEILL